MADINLGPVQGLVLVRIQEFDGERMATMNSPASRGDLPGRRQGIGKIRNER